MEAKARPQPAEKEGRAHTVRPPVSLSDGTPLERMTELTRRIASVPKDEAYPPKKRRKQPKGL